MLSLLVQNSVSLISAHLSSTLTLHNNALFWTFLNSPQDLVNLGLTVTSSGVSGTYHTIKYSANSESTVVCSYYQKRKFFEEVEYYQDVLGYSQFSTAILDAAADGKYIGGSRALATVKNALYRPSDGSITETVSLARGKFYAFLCVATTTVPNSSERDMVFGYVGKYLPVERREHPWMQ